MKIVELTILKLHMSYLLFVLKIEIAESSLEIPVFIGTSIKM